MHSLPILCLITGSDFVRCGMQHLPYTTVSPENVQLSSLVSNEIEGCVWVGHPNAYNSAMACDQFPQKRIFPADT